MPETSRKPGRFRVALVDDHFLVRDQVRLLLERTEDLEVCGEATGETEAMALIADLAPDLLLLDLSLAEGTGMGVIERARDAAPSVRSLVLSMQDERLVAMRLLEKGARGFVSKDESGRTLLEAVRRVLGGQVWLSADLSGRLRVWSEGIRDGLRDSPDGGLSERDERLLELLATGLPDADVASRLDIPDTSALGSCCDRLHHRLGLASNDELRLFALARRLGDR